MTLQEIRTYFETELHSVYDLNEVRSFFHLLTEHYLALTRVYVAMALHQELTTEQIGIFEIAVQRLIAQEPIQYILGETVFYGLPFEVDKNVLIPRPETEELVDWIVNDYKTTTPQKKIKILDIGTGSGCIAITLAKQLKHAEVYAIDVSDQALAIAKKNALQNEVAVKYIQADILDTEILPDHFDIIVSNPPYVRTLEKVEIQPNVLDNEPHLALFVSDKNPLVFYAKITALASRFLNPGGTLYFEINQYLSADTVGIIKQAGFATVELKKDMCANDRMIRAKQI